MPQIFKIGSYFVLGWECRTLYALNLINSYPFSLSSLIGVSLSASSILKLYQISLRLRSQSLKGRNFDTRQRKIKNNTDVYLKIFLPDCAKFLFLNHMRLDTPQPHSGLTKTSHWNRYTFTFPKANRLPTRLKSGLPVKVNVYYAAINQEYRKTF